MAAILISFVCIQISLSCFFYEQKNQMSYPKRGEWDQ